MRRASESNLRNWNKTIAGITDSIAGISGIALEIVDGGHLDQVNISDIVMEGIQTPIFIRLGSRRNATGSMKNIQISNVIATNCSLIPSIISGVPGFDIENVNIRNCTFNCMGKGKLVSYQDDVPEAENKYPENRMFGSSLPAFGFYIRHAKDIQLTDIRFNLINPDSRPALWVEKTASVHTDNLTIKGTALANKMIYFRDLNDK